MDGVYYNCTCTPVDISPLVSQQSEVISQQSEMISQYSEMISQQSEIISYNSDIAETTLNISSEQSETVIPVLFVIVAFIGMIGGLLIAKFRK